MCLKKYFRVKYSFNVYIKLGLNYKNPNNYLKFAYEINKLDLKQVIFKQCYW